MTDLDRPVTRRTRLPHRRHRRLIVSLLPGDVLGLREERTRTTWYLPIGAAFDLAVKLAVRARREQRKRGR